MEDNLEQQNIGPEEQALLEAEDKLVDEIALAVASIARQLYAEER